MLKPVLSRPLFLLLLLACPAGIAFPQARPVAGAKFEITYHPNPAGPLAEASALQAVYTFNAWGNRTGTRLALLENVLHPDSIRIRRVDLQNTPLGWKATIAIPLNASLLSYYITDGERRDDNGERTYTWLVYGEDGRPVRNAHFFNVGFLELARESLEKRSSEAEEEIRLYPSNFQAWYKVFSLQFEQEKGSERGFQRIIERLTALESAHPDNQEFFNLAAQTYYYILRDTEKGLAYRNKIGIPNLWPDVLLMFDRETVQETERRTTLEREQRRAQLLNAPLPDMKFMGFDQKEHSVREDSGSVILLVVWATTSQRSQQLLSTLARMHETCAAQGVKVVAVALDTDEQAVRTFAADRKLPFEPRMNMGSYVLQLGVDSIPQTFMIDRQLIVRRIVIGFRPETERELQDALASML